MSLYSGTIASNQTICYNGNPAAFTSVADASGGTTGYTYQWQYSTDSGSTWVDIYGANATTYDSGTLTATRWFRRRVIDSGTPAETGYTNTVIVTVYPVLNAGSIGSNQTIYSGTTPALLTSISGASGASGDYVYQWQYSTNGTSYSNIAGATSTTYQPPALYANTYYKRRVYDTFCGIGYADYSNVVLITVSGAPPATPSAPSGLTATNIDCATCDLQWINNGGGIVKNVIQRWDGIAFNDEEEVSFSATTFNGFELYPNTENQIKVCAVDSGDTYYCSDAITAQTTYIAAPTGFSGYLDDKNVVLSWTNISTGATELSVYRCLSGGTCEYIAYLPYSATTYTDTTTIREETYSYSIISECHGYGYGTPFIDFTIPTAPLVPPFCDGSNYAASGSTCGNSDGVIAITNIDYFTYYDFTLTDITGGTYTFNTTTGEATGLSSNYYFLTATVKPEYWYYYGRETCTFDWIKIEDTDNPAFLVGVSVKPQQCGPFDRQFGRIFYNVSGLTSGNTYSFYAFTSDLSLYYSKTGITSTEDFILANANAECYWVLIRDEVTGCALLLDNRCVPSIPFFSLGGIKKLYLAKWSSDLDYNYWKDSDEDYFLEFEDTSFFTSTKIKEYLSFTGGTTGITWYELPVANKVVKLGQKLEKLRQGFIFTDTLSVAIAKYDAAKWTQMATLLNPENKWIYIMQDADGYYWTGGYLHGAKISAYNFKTGARGEDNGCTLEIQAVSENKLLVNIDENYVINYVE